MNPLHPLTRPVASLAGARARRLERRQLREGFASYRTPSERAELAAILSRLDDHELARLEGGAGGVAA